MSTEKRTNGDADSYRRQLLALGRLREAVGLSWRALASQSAQRKSTVEGWLRDGSIPDDPRGVAAVAALILARAERARMEVDSRLKAFGWVERHQDAVAARYPEFGPSRISTIAGIGLGVSGAGVAAPMGPVDEWSAKRLGSIPQSWVKTSA